ncbi:hypothetical protein LY78DRAFT_468836 [Colletotrichum sublineola]|nr:hypothetical protein LY78DRAFT_468836 [Colletotrichum sublineola]
MQHCCSQTPANSTVKRHSTCTLWTLELLIAQIHGRQFSSTPSDSWCCRNSAFPSRILSSAIPAKSFSLYRYKYEGAVLNMTNEQTEDRWPRSRWGRWGGSARNDLGSEWRCDSQGFTCVRCRSARTIPIRHKIHESSLAQPPEIFSIATQSIHKSSSFSLVPAPSSYSATSPPYRLVPS